MDFLLKKPEKHWSEMSIGELQEEYRKCAIDPVYFIREYIMVVHQKRGLVPFDLYGFQEFLIKDIGQHRFNIIRKFRQAGITTIACAYSLWLAIFQDYKNVVILSIGDRESTDVLDRILVMYDELPPFIKPQWEERNKHTLKLENKSRIKSLPSGKSSGRSLAGAFLIVDEAAFIESISEIWGAAYPILSTGGQALIISTVNGMGNWYYDIYSEAEKGHNSFHIVNINWKMHPEYNRTEGYEWLYEEMASWDPAVYIDDWEKITRSNMGLKLWRQEFECEFLGTGDTFLDADTLEALFKNVKNTYQAKYNQRMRYWKEPQPFHEYIIGVDTSYGRGRDYSAFQILDIYNGEQVAEFYSNTVPVDDFCQIINDMGLYYSTAMLMLERNGIGLILAKKLFEHFEYPNIWMDENSPKMDIGLLMTQKVRDGLLAEMEIAVRTLQVKINSKRTVNELLTFIINEEGKVEADVNKHDDLVMSLAFSIYGFNLMRNTVGMEFEHVEEDFGSALPLMPDKKPYTLYHQTPFGVEEEDYQWLIK